MGFHSLRAFIGGLAGLLVSGCSGMVPGSSEPGQEEVAATRVFLWFADGGQPPVQGPPCVGKTPPAFKCDFAESVDGCKREIVERLERWYGDLNLVFTTDRFARVDQSVVITDRGDWCEQPRSVGGIAPLLCEPLAGATAYAFQCGNDAHTCASIIAQEHAHTIGLAHTMSPIDVMFASIGPRSDGFEARENQVADSDCRPTQNSNQLMRDRLGLWAGGPKPSALARPR